jgi:hypothetical protein
MQPVEKIPPPLRAADELSDPSLQYENNRPNSVLLLLPMSGSNGFLGQDMVNVCLLSLDNNNSSNITFHVVDSADPSLDKFSLSRRFPNLRAIIGPVFAQEAKQYGALFPNIPLLSLSSDPNVNSNHVFACGPSHRDEIHTLFTQMNNQDITGALVILPEGSRGDQILDIILDELKGSEENDSLEIIRYTSISQKAATKYAKNSGKKVIFVIDHILNLQKLSDKYVLTLSSVALSNREVWNGVFFAYCEVEKQQKFIPEYRNAFGGSPTPLAMVFHDLFSCLTEFINTAFPTGVASMQRQSRFLTLVSRCVRKRPLQLFQLLHGLPVPTTDSASSAEGHS